MTWDITATVPDSLTVVSNGVQLSDRPAPEGEHTVHWRQASPSQWFGMTLNIAPYRVVQTTWQYGNTRIPLVAYTFDGQSGDARAMLSRIGRTLTLYSTLTGVPFPWPRYSLSAASEQLSGKGGRDGPTGMTINTDFPDARAERDEPQIASLVFMHEPAHEWFGGYMGQASYQHQWLLEGFADFMAAQVWRDQHGPRGDQDFIYEYNAIKRNLSAQDILLLPNGGGNVYYRGPIVLDMLRKYLGDDRFWASVRRLLTHHAFGNATTEDFRIAIREATGEDLTWFFDEWVYSPGMAQLTVGAAYDSVAKRLTLTVDQTQDTAARGVIMPPGDTVMYHAPAVYHMPVTIRVGTAHGDVIATARLDARRQTIMVDSVPSAPTMVAFDDEDGIYKTLTFPQPTAWLATLLARDPSPVQTSWAAQQLGLRAATDSVARAALIGAATGATDARTRRKAVIALARVNTPDVLATLHAARHDASAIVRVVAVMITRLHMTPAIVPELREIFVSDSSDAVRRSALVALSLDPGTPDSVRVAVLRQALSMPSFESALHIAALDLISMRPGPCDTALVRQLELYIGDRPHVAAALGKLRTHCPEAEAILTRHRDDSRAYVRRWVRSVYAGVLKPRMDQ
jgi:aminopeptidase N